MNKQRLPVTLLSGFLGSGKTTLLNKILNKNHGLRIAVIVNDMSDVNIDSDLIAMSSITQTNQKIIEMHNGCICCTLREDLLIEVSNLANNHNFDYLIIESTGISEPLPVAETFSFSLPDGRPLNDIAYLDTLATIVDGVNFLCQYKEAELLPNQDDGKDKTLSDLLIEQIEFANIVLISKCDLINPTQIAELKSIIRSLNPKAKILSMTEGMIPFETIVNTNMYSLEDAQKAPGWLAILRGESVSETTEFGIESFVWHSRRPVHPKRFSDFLDSEWSYGRLLRSKGFFWLASQIESICLWNQAGGIMRYQYAGQWWVFTPKINWPENIEVRKWINAKWDIEVGDCRQEIVFIGQNLNKNKLLKDLDKCLLTETEVLAGPQEWLDYMDPFPLWSPKNAIWPNGSAHENQEIIAFIE